MASIYAHEKISFLGCEKYRHVGCSNSVAGEMDNKLLMILTLETFLKLCFLKRFNMDYYFVFIFSARKSIYGVLLELSSHC